MIPLDRPLNLDLTPSECEHGTKLFGKNWIWNPLNKAIQNEDGWEFRTDIDITFNMKPIGALGLPDGYIIFMAQRTGVYPSTSSRISWYDNDSNLIKSVFISSKGFHPDKQVLATYSYNFKGELILCMSQGIGDELPETFYLNLSTCNTTMTEGEKWLMDISPDIVYPFIIPSVVNSGALLTGSYQFGIAYELETDVFTDSMILTPHIHINVTSENGGSPRTNSGKSIKLSITSPTVPFKRFRIYVVYKGGDTEEVRYSSPYNCYASQEITIDNINSLFTGSIDNIANRHIPYIQCEGMTNFQGEMIQGNVKTVEYEKNGIKIDDIGNKLANRVAVRHHAFASTESNEERGDVNDRIGFQSNEVYALYLDLYDYKGNFINSYPIPRKSFDTTSVLEGDTRLHYIPAYNHGDTLFRYTKSAVADTETHYLRTNSDGDLFLNVDVQSMNVNSEMRGIFGTTFVNSYSEYGGSISFWKQEYYDNYGLGCNARSICVICPLNSTSQTLKIKSLGFSMAAKKTKGIYSSKATLIVVKMNGFAAGSRAISLDGTMVGQTINGKLITRDNVVFSATLNNSNIKSYEWEQDIDLTFNSINDRYGIFLVSTFETYGREYTGGEKYYLPTCVSPNVVYEDYYTGEGFTAQDNNQLVNLIKCKINPSDVNMIVPAEFRDIITHMSISVAKRDGGNNRVITQAMVARDSAVNDIATNTYNGLLGNNFDFRAYSLDLLFLQPLFNKVEVQTRFRGMTTSWGTNEYADGNGSAYMKGQSKVRYWKNNDAFYHGNNVKDNRTYFINVRRAEVWKRSIQTYEFRYIQADSSSQKNTFGESHYRLTIDNIDTNIGGDFLHGIVDILNTSSRYYSDLYKQELYLASPVRYTKNAFVNDLIFNLTGDTFIGDFTVRYTSPDQEWKFEDANDTTKDKYVHKILFGATLQNRLNLDGRYGGNTNTTEVFKSHNLDIRGESWRRATATRPNIDNFINTPTGQGYDLSYNWLGVSLNNILEEIVGMYHIKNRIIRSDVATTESVALGWRKFRQDNYYDVPLESGKIISLASDDSNLYIQQEYSLRVASVKDSLAGDSVDSAYVGSGDLFDRMPKEMMYDKTGYIGCRDKFASLITGYGYIVIDSVKGRFFLVKGENTHELTNEGIRYWAEKYFTDKLEEPCIESGYYITFDSKYERLLFVKHKRYKDNQSIAISFAFGKGFCCFHDYNPMYGFHNRKNLYYLAIGSYNAGTEINRNILYKANHTNKCIFQTWNKPAKTIVQLAYTKEIAVDKVFNNLWWQSQIKIGNRIFYDETWNRLFIHSDTQCTEMLEVNIEKDWFGTESGVNKATKWFLNKIEDSVIDDKKEFVENYIDIISTNVKKVAKDWWDVSYFISAYAVITFIYDNLFHNPTTDKFEEYIKKGTNLQARLTFNQVNMDVNPSNR